MQRKIANGDDISQNGALWLMIGMLLVAFMFAAIGLDWDMISTDELNSISSFGAFDEAHGPLQIAALTRSYASDQLPLYYVLGAYWARLTGYSHVTLRLLSALFGLLAAAWLYRLARLLFDRRVALLSALLFCSSALVLEHMHNLRMYTFVALLTTLHTWLYWQLAHRNRRGWKWWFAFVATCAAFLYTHGFAAAYFFGLGLCHLLFVRRSRRWRQVFVAWLLGLALFLVYVPELLSGVAYAQQEIKDWRRLDALQLAIVLALSLANQLAILLVPLGVGAALSIRSGKGALTLRLLFMAAAMFAAMAGANASLRFFDWDRMHYFMFLWHIAMIVFAAALWSLPWRRAVLPLCLLIWVYGGIRASQPDFVPDHPYVVYRETSLLPLHDYARHLSGKVNSLDALLGFRDSFLLVERSKVYGATFVEYFFGAILGMDGVFLHASEGRYRLKRDVNAILQARPHLLLAHDPSGAPPNYAPTLHHIEEAGFNACPPLVDEPTLRIQKHRHPVMVCDHAPAGVVDYENGMRLLDRAVRYESDSEVIQVLLWWEIPDESMLDDYNISLQLFAANGEKIAQIDRHLDAKLTPWGVTELSTDNLANGDYQLRLIVYEREGGAKLSGSDASTGESTKLLALHDFAIESA